MFTKEIKTEQNHTVTVKQLDGNEPGILFLAGLGAPDLFEKGQFLAQKCQETGRAFTFINWQTPENGTPSEWRANLQETFNEVCKKPHLIIASSFGAWVGTLLAQDLISDRQADQLIGMIFINPLFDGSNVAEAGIGEQGRAYLSANPDHTIPFKTPSMFKPFILQQKHLEDGRRNLVLAAGSPALPTLPTHIYHSKDDPTAPIALSEAFIRKGGGYATLEPVTGGHELNNTEFMQRLWTKTEEMAGTAKIIVPTTAPQIPTP